MPVTPFDFDVITGPSVPRDDRVQDPDTAGADEPEAVAPARQPRAS